MMAIAASFDTEHTPSVHTHRFQKNKRVLVAFVGEVAGKLTASETFTEHVVQEVGSPLFVILIQVPNLVGLESKPATMAHHGGRPKGGSEFDFFVLVLSKSECSSISCSSTISCSS